VGPAFESFLTVVVPIALAIALSAYLFRRELARVVTYLRAWQREDEVDDACRAAAVREVENPTAAVPPQPPHEETQAEDRP
jgi:ABC-type long-subunit fatty acid transport system fused permease/ATPase subunit